MGVSLSYDGVAIAYRSSGKMKFGALPVDVSDDINKQRAFVAALVPKHCPGKQLASSKEYFAVLQAVVDKQLLTKRQTWEPQALGVCFGDALTGHIPGLNWCLVTDEYGTDPTLRFKDTSTRFNALTISPSALRMDGKSTSPLSHSGSSILSTRNHPNLAALQQLVSRLVWRCARQ